MKKYHAWVLVLFVMSVMLGISALSPKYSQANRTNPSSPESDRQPVSDKGSEGLSLNIPRRGHTSTALRDGRVAIMGGQNQLGPVGEVEVLDPNSQSIKIAATLRVPRARHTATLLADGGVLVAGGWDQKTRLNSTEIFDPLTNSFSGGPRLRKARAAHTSTALQDGRILIVGGDTDASVELFDPATNRTTLLKSRMTAARSFHEAVLLSSGNVLIVGGLDPDGRALRSAEVLNTRTMTFSETPAPMRIKRVRPTLRVLQDGKVQVIGGDYDGTMEIYDPAKNRFAAAAHLSPTADVFPTEKVLESRTRAAFIDSKMALDQSAAADPAKPLHHYSVANKRALDSFSQLLERADYSSAEVAEGNRAVIAGGVGKNGEYVRSVVVMKSSTASITTNKAEYLQGEWPAISGSGWQPNEKISIVRLQARTGHKRTSIEVVADEQGNFTSAGMPSAGAPRGMTYTLTAMGERSADVAQTTYCDALPKSAPKPKNGHLAVPILFRDASFELDEGLMVWEIKSGGPSRTKPPELTAMKANFATQTFDFETIEDQPCLGLGGTECSVLGATFDVRLKNNSFITFGGGVEGDIFAGNLKIAESVSGTIILDVTAKNVDFGPFPIPGTGVTFGADVEGVTAELTLGIVLRAKLEFNDPGTTFRTTLNFNQSSAIEFKDPPTLAGSITADINFKLVESTGGCLTISVGPEVGVEVAVDTDVCDIGFEAAANISPFIKGCFNIDTSNANCPTFSIPITVGIGGLLEGQLNLCITDVMADIDAVLFELPVATISGGLNDTTPPTITCPANQTRSTDTDQCNAVVTYPDPSVNDNCPNPTFTCAPASGTTFAKGVTTVSCTAKDTSQNQSSPCTFTVTVNDTQLPTISCPAQQTSSTDPNKCDAVVTYPAPTANDNCPGVTTSCSPASGSTFPKGTTTVSCKATDTSNNMSAPCTFNVVVNDTQAPTISCPANQVKGTDPNKCDAVVTFPNSIASDNCPGATASCSPASGSTFPKGTTTVSCKATDASGNMSAPCTFTVTVNDTQAPTVTCPANVTAVAPAACPSASALVVSYPAATATDNCPPAVTAVCSPPSGSTFAVGTTTVTCTSTDAAGNTGSCTFTVTVFNGCIQDDSDPGKVVLFNTKSGVYRFCCGGTIYTGVGLVTIKGCVTTISHIAPDRRVQINTDNNIGTASLQSPPGTIRCTIQDRNVRNNNCFCQ